MSRSQRCLVACSFTWFLPNWGNLTDAPVLPLLGTLGAQFGAPLLAHIALAYPDGRVRSGFDRVVLGLIYTVALGVNVFILLTFDPRAAGCRTCGWEPALFPSATGAPIRAAIELDNRAAAVLVPLFLVAIGRRWRRASPAQRRDLAPLWAAATVLAVVFLIQAFTSPGARPGSFAVLVVQLQGLLQIAIPVVFLWGLLSTRLARSAVGDLLLELSRPHRPGELRAVLARTLGDPGVDLLYATDDDRWIDADGLPRPRPVDSPHRMVTLIGAPGAPLAALVHDRALDVGLVTAAATAAGMTIENERLHAQIRAQLDEVVASRQRILEAGDQERRRVERDLHDGAQQRLVTLAVSLAMLRDRLADDQAVAAGLHAAAAELRRAIQDLRELARGIHPAILSEEGLPAAVESLAERSALPVRVDADFDERLPEPIETAAYFVVAESLANAAKHARAGQVRIALSLVGRCLHVEVSDDGVGGADPRQGSGLRGLQDRVAAVRGTLRVAAAEPTGTTVRAEMPL